MMGVIALWRSFERNDVELRVLIWSKIWWCVADG
jgi:hypothetical protein